MAALTLTTESYFDKVLGAWQGKSAGITLGAGIRGQLVPSRLNYYSPVPGQPASSVGLDFSLVWLNALEQSGSEISPADLRRAWNDNLDYTQDEFGYALLNLKRGLPPPSSGSHNNWFRHSTGAVLRADIWAMVAPGNPQVAAAFAWHDASIDHAEEGVWAAMFIAAVGSASFFLRDPLPLITIGLAMIPKTCRTARAVKTALAAAQKGASWMEARESVQHEVGNKNFSDAPQNVGFISIGLLFGASGFGESLCGAVNCGYDTETVGGALGAILGIQEGAIALPQDWVRPLGDVIIPGNGMRSLIAPVSLQEVAKRTATIGVQIASVKCPDIDIADAERAAFAPTPFEETSLPVPPPPANTPPAPLSAVDFVEFTAPPPATVIESEPAALSEAMTVSSEALKDSLIIAKSRDDIPVTPEESAAVRDFFDAPTFDSIPKEAMPPKPTAEPEVPDFAPQAVSEAEPVPLVAEESQAFDSAVNHSLNPDPMGAIAWADSSLVKPLLVTPPNSFSRSVGNYDILIDLGDAPVISHLSAKTLAVTIVNRGAEAFSGKISLLAPHGWQVSAPSSFGQRQYIAGANGTLRAEYRIFAPEGQGKIEIANSLVVRLTPDSGGASLEGQFVMLGASCWWTVGVFANFDGEGFDRSYLPEDRPGLNESYIAKSLQSVKWEKNAQIESVLDLEPLFRGSSGVCYGQTILRCPQTRDAKLTVSTNSGVKVWLNGTLALRRHQRGVFRPTLGDENWTADVTLSYGDNPVMVKWVRGSEPFQFSLTVSDRNGRALPEIGNTSW